MHLSRYRSSLCKAVLPLPHSHDNKGDARLRGVEGRAHKEAYDSPQQPVQYGKPTVHTEFRPLQRSAPSRYAVAAAEWQDARRR